jgi:Ca2+-binding RTX toxin-like protein
VLWGGPGADRIRGLGGRDIVCGGTGDDVIRAGTGRDEVFAGPGADFVSDRNWSSGLQGGPGADTIRSRTPEVFFKVPSSMYGGRGSDDLRGGRGADQIYGQRGPDALRGGASPNTLVGGRGPDVVHPGPQGHVYLRGDGDHVFGVKGARVGLFYTFVSAEVHASLLSGEGHVQGRRRVDRLPTEADLIGSRYDDTLIGSDTLYQELIGLAGDDFIYGSGGSEDILGGPGDDYLDGGAPAQPAEEDQIAGGPGEDVCVSSADNTGCEINP